MVELPVRQPLPDGTPGVWVEIDGGWSLQPDDTEARIAASWSLQVWEISSDTADYEWDTWATYTDPAKARQRERELTTKGYRARVLSPGGCSLCGEAHPDGACLL